MKGYKIFKKNLLDISETIIIGTIIYLMLQIPVQSRVVEGASMSPILNKDERLFIKKWIYIPTPDFLLKFSQDQFLFHPPQRGEIIVFTAPYDYERNFVKRIIGIPGDIVDIDGQNVYVNGEIQTYSSLKTDRIHEDYPVVVPEKEYFVLGDNRPVSLDSRNWGTLREELIIGKVWFVYWPVEHIIFFD